MPLPSHGDEAEMRALEPLCAPHSSAAERAVTELAEQPLARRKSYLLNAVIWGLPNIVRCALEAKTSADTSMEEGEAHWPVLVVAAEHGRTESLRALLHGGANHRLADSDGFTALAAAAYRGHLDCLLLLLLAGADPNCVDRAGNTPLLEAIARKHVACAQALLPSTDLLCANRLGRTALHVAVASSSAECFQLVLPHVMNVDVRTVPGCHANGEPIPSFNETALHFACLSGEKEMAKALLKRGASRMVMDNVGRTPLHHAAQEGHLACASLLTIKMSIDEVNAIDENGVTPLHMAAKNGHVKLCGALLEAGARLDLKTTSVGDTPLAVAQHYQPSNGALHALLSGNAAAPPAAVCRHCGQAENATARLLRSCGACFGARGLCGASAWPGQRQSKECQARKAERERATRVGRVPSCRPRERPLLAPHA